MESAPPAGRGGTREKLEGPAIGMRDWLDQATASAPAGAGRGTGLESAPPAGRGGKRESLSAITDPMDGWFEKSAGRGQGLDNAPSGAGRGGKRESLSSIPDPMEGWFEKSSGRGQGLEAPPSSTGRGREQRKSMRISAAESNGGMDSWINSLFVPGGRGRGGLIAPPPAGRSMRRSSGGSTMEKDVLAAVGTRTALSGSISEQDPEAFVAILQQEASNKKQKQTLRTTLPVLVVFPKHLGAESKVYQIPARLTVAGAIDYLVNLHGSRFSGKGIGLSVGTNYEFDDGFSRSEHFPFLDLSKQLQYYEEVITTTPLYWTEQHKEPEEHKASDFKARVVFDSKLGLPPVQLPLRWSDSVTDANAAVERTVASSKFPKHMRLGIPLELQHLPLVNVEIVKLGMREQKDFPHLELGRTLSEYQGLLQALDYLEMT